MAKKQNDSNGFLVLTFRQGEGMVMDNGVRIFVKKIKGGSETQLAIECPKSVNIVRTKVLEKK